MGLQQDLISWYREHARDLPWRRAPLAGDPYAILVSEVMLQQTRVDTVIPHYNAWMERFPDARSLADAPLEVVLAHWAGLGYYRRARNLHAAAKRLAAGLPTSVQTWRALPGVGAYTAAAVVSIAQGVPAACVDGNVRRVVARLAGITGPVDAGPGARAIEAWAATALDPIDPGTWNQAMMELGALVCKPRDPGCSSCPVRLHCLARKTGAQATIPTPRRRAAPQVERHEYALLARRGAILMVREPGDGLLGGLWRLPGGPVTSGALTARVEAETGLRLRLHPEHAQLVHRFTHKTWHMTIRRALPDETDTQSPRSPAHRGHDEARLEVRWTRPDETALRRIGVSSAMKKAIRALHPATD